MPSQLPSNEDFQLWLLHPVTILQRDWAHRKREALKETWADGNFSAAFTVEMAVKNAGATGACSILKEVIAPNYQDMIDEVTDEQQRIEAPRPGSTD